MHTQQTKMKAQNQLTFLSKDIIRILLYFDIFKYPLTSTEVQMNASVLNVKKEDVESELSILYEMNLIKTDGKFYYLSKGKENIIERRRQGNIKAEQYIAIAHKVSKFIACFPFVRGVFLSGSVSKGYADKNSDIDYFIITEPGKLWLARTALILFKKIFLLNSKKYFCLNYFIDSDHLEISDKNLFTAREINYLIPVFNAEVYDKFKSENLWINSYFPNFHKTYTNVNPERIFFVKQLFEKLLSGSLGTMLDSWCMRVTEKFWKNKYRHKIHVAKSSIRCEKYVSKFHPHDFEYKTLNIYQARIRVYEEHYNVSLQR